MSQHPGDTAIDAASRAGRPELLVAVMGSLAEGVYAIDPGGALTLMNPAAEAMLGWSEAELRGRDMHDAVHHTVSRDECRLIGVCTTSEVATVEDDVFVCRDGTPLPVSYTCAPLREDGRTTGAVVVFRDTSDRRRADAARERLVSLGGALARALTPSDVADASVRLGRAALGAAAGAVAVLDSVYDRLDVIGSDGLSEGTVAQWRTLPLKTPTPLSEATRTGSTIVLESADAVIARYPSLADLDEADRPGARVAIPLLVEDRPIGAISLVFSGPRRFDEGERGLMLSLALQCAQALERARSYEREHAARERAAFLARASELLAGSLDPRTTLDQVAGLVVPDLADWCTIDLVAPDGTIRLGAVAHTDPGKARWARELAERYQADPAEPTGMPGVIRSGRSQLYRELPDEVVDAAARDQEHRRALRKVGIASAMAVPLRARGRTLGAIGFATAESGRRYGPIELALAEDFARHAALAIDNARLYQAEAEAAETLQLSLLPESLPDLPGVELCARYRPGARGAEVGGDWYDVLALPGGQVGVAIGDVVGRGIRAASIMGQMRAALRAYALDGKPCYDVLRRLNELSCASATFDMATVLYAIVDPETGSLRFSCAGHPPMLVREPDGTVAPVPGGRGLPLGVAPDGEYETAQTELAPGAVAVLYTDGLIERRDETIDAGVARLSAALAASPEPVDELCDAVLATMLTDRDGPDDVAILGLRRAG